MSKIAVMSVGGSLIYPNEIDTGYIKQLKSLIVSSKNKFVIIIGGGSICRKYQAALKKFTKDDIQSDLMGIQTTLVNSYLVKTAMGKIADPKVHQVPKKIKFKKVLFAAGWKPGCSTDKDAVLWAIKLGSNIVINLTNTDYVYDKDPRKHKNAKPFKKISWDDYRNLIGGWKAGLNSPFDPVASQLAQKKKMKVYIINGKKLSEVKKALNNKPFIGTVIG